MKSLILIPALILAGAVSAQAADAGSTGQTGQSLSQSSPSNPMSIKQELTSNLAKQGYTDISVLPTSFLVHAKDSKGRPVAMVIGPDSVIEVVEAPKVADAGAPQGQPEKPLSAQQLDAFLQQYGGKDGSLSLQQAQKAADKHFDALDLRHTGKVDQKELAPAGISTQDFNANNPDKDTTLEKDEYANLVKEKYDAADTAHKNVLNKEELSSTAGQALMRLLR